MDNHNNSTIENVLRFWKWRPCILGILIGCVCTSILGLSIGLIVHPYLLSKEQTLCPTEIQWNKCSKDCGNGTQYGIKINRKDVNGKCVITSNRSIERSFDNDDACPIDGGWGPWKLFGSCSVTCGTGLVPIVRTCDNPVPSQNGKHCYGKHHGLGTCIKEQCADKNLALNTETEQSSTYTYWKSSTDPKPGPSRKSSLAVDGNFDAGNHFVCSHTKNDSKAWWAVDLADVYDIDRVVIYGRTDCCTDRLTNFDIDIFKSRNTGNLEFPNFQDGIKSKCHYQPGEIPNHVLNATCPNGANGQIVRVQLRDISYLTLCEVEVYGTRNHPTNLIVSDFEMEKPYIGSEVNIINSKTEEECRSFCGKPSNECIAAYIRQSNTCGIVGNSTTKL